jgi:hypothetical protein
MSKPDQEADPRPWEQPGALRRDVEPHRGAELELLAGAAAVLGVLAIPCAAAGRYVLFAPLLAGVWAVLAGAFSGWVLWAGGEDLTRMRRGAVDPEGRRKTESAWGLALFGLIAALLAGVILAVSFAGLI